MKVKLRPDLKKLALFLAANFLIVHLLTIFVFRIPWKETSLFDTFVFFFRIANVTGQWPEQQGADSWNPMIRALDYAQTSPGEGLYQKIFFEEKVKFQYPPPSLIPVRILRTFLSPNATVFALNTISFFLLIWTALCAARIFLEIAERDSRDSGGSSRFTPADRLAVYMLSLFAVLTFYPSIVAFRLGQIQVWVTALFAWMTWMMLREKERPAGILAGILTLIKPQYGLLLLWAFIRRRRAFALSFVAVVFAGTGISLLLFPAADHFDYLRVLSFLTAHGESYYPNQSVNGILNRLLQNGEILTFQKHEFPPYHPVVFWGTVLSSVFFLCLGVIGNRKNRIGAIDLCFASVAFTMASPVAWQHHYGILLPVYALLLPPLLREEEKRRPIRFGLGLAFVLASNHFVMLLPLAEAPFGLNLLLSYLFGGSLLTLFILRSSARCE